jgi:ribosome-binding protein aMBF1 (putative translation factor)
MARRRNALCEYGSRTARLSASKKVVMYKSLHTRHNELFLSLLRDRREALGMRQADLAERLGQSQTIVSRVENGERRLDVIELRAWLRALKLGFLPFMKALDARLRDASLHETRLGREFTTGRRPR